MFGKKNIEIKQEATKNALSATKARLMMNCMTCKKAMMKC